MVKPNHPLTYADDNSHIMAHKQDCAPFAARDLVYLAETLLLELSVTDRKNFVDNQDLRLEMRSYSEGQADIHARRVPFYWGIEKGLDLCKIDDLVELVLDLSAGHAEDRTV